MHSDRVDISWKLYELRGRFYRGRPKDGSIRNADLPPFLADLLARQLAAPTSHRCTCRSTEPPWCPGDDYVFLGPGHGHFRRSSYGERFFRPAADGWYPARGQRPAMPVLADVGGAFPGRSVPPWPAAVAGEAFTPPTRRGVPRMLSDSATQRLVGAPSAEGRFPGGWMEALSRTRRGRVAAWVQGSRPPQTLCSRRGCPSCLA